MAETTTPLISATTTNTPEPPLPSLDSTIERCIGDYFGWAHLTQSLLVSLSWLFDAQQTFISIFTDSFPKWHCTDPITSPCTDICRLPDSAWAWDESKHASVVSEWDLHCAAPFLRGLPASAFFSGCLVGGLLLSSLADSALGRRNMLLLSSLAMSVSALLTAFSGGLWEYVGLRFVCGFARASVGSCAFVLSTEIVGRRWREAVGLGGFVGFSVGFLSLPALAYALRGSSWRSIYVWTSVPGIIYSLIVYFFVLESPRWLFVQGRTEEAIETLKRISPPHQHVRLTAANLSTATTTDKDSSSAAAVDLYSAVKLLLNKRWALKRLSTVMVAGFGIGVVYNGLPLAIANLSFNLYLGVAFNAALEIPATLLAIFLVSKFNRRSSFLALISVSAISSAAVCFLTAVGLWVSFQMAFELASFAANCAALCVLLVQTTELFPTCVRNSAVSIVRQALVMGGVFGPLLADATGRGVSYGVFGAAVGFFGMFAAWLPETRGGILCDSMDEEEHKATSSVL